MVDVQTVGVLVTAASVSVAAIYYIMTLRVQQANMKATLETRRISLIESMTSRLNTIEMARIFQEVARCEWTDYEDFIQKYGSNSNLEANIKRNIIYGTFNSMGAMLRKGMVEKDDLYDHVFAIQSIQLWLKYKPVIEETRRRLNGQDWLKDFEYFADEMLKEKLRRDPPFKLPTSLGVVLPEK